MSNLNKIKEEGRKRLDILHRNRTTSVSRKELHDLSDEMVEKTYFLTIGRVEEIVICSAIKMSDGYIIKGHRHNDCLMTASRTPRYREERPHGENQGFVTSKNRYVTREEGCKIQKQAGIKSYYETHRENPAGAYLNGELYSEDLY